MLVKIPAYRPLKRKIAGVGQLNRMLYTQPSFKPPRGVVDHAGAFVFCCLVVGGVLLFRMLPRVVSLALSGLASGFGMGPGVSSMLWPPTSIFLLFGLCCVRYCGVDAVLLLLFVLLVLVY